FITMFASALHCFLTLIQSIPLHNISLRSILILSTHLRPGPPSDLFWLSRQYPICIPLLPLRATYPAHLILFALIVLIMLDPNILLSTLFSNTFSPCSTLNVRDKI
ncbi:hypothetical protein B7P43_G11598, partial [Cryptotermes secundus]